MWKLRAVKYWLLVGLRARAKQPQEVDKVWSLRGISPSYVGPSNTILEIKAHKNIVESGHPK